MWNYDEFWIVSMYVTDGIDMPKDTGVRDASFLRPRAAKQQD